MFKHALKRITRLFHCLPIPFRLLQSFQPLSGIRPVSAFNSQLPREDKFNAEAHENVCSRQIVPDQILLARDLGLEPVKVVLHI